MSRVVARAIALAGLAAAVASSPAAGQQLEPRAYSASPTGANFVGVAYAHSSGDVVFDPSLPITDANARINVTSPFYVRTIGVFGRGASASVLAPYAWGMAEGNVGGTARRADRSGFGDAAVRLAVNLIGNPALKPREFAASKHGATLGASLVVTAPTGQYDGSRLVNLGTNRWALKPEVGLSYPWRRWFLETYAGAWFFTDNADFYGGQYREQAPLAVGQAHVVYTIKPRLWLAFDATYYRGGETTVDGVKGADRQSNSRTGATLALPVWTRHSIKFAYAKGITARIGSKFETFAVSWQYYWFD